MAKVDDQNVTQEVCRGEPAGLAGTFAWLEPLLSFGGLLSWPLLAASALRGPRAVTAAGAGWQAFCLMASNLPEDSPLLARLRRIYAAAAERSFETVHLLDPTIPTPSRRRPEVCLILPHGHFCIAGKFNGTKLKESGTYPNAAFFVDGILCQMSPGMKLAARMSGASEVYPVGDVHVRKAMKKGDSIFMFPGGFVEAAQSTTSGLRLYSGTYGYWCRRALEFGYDVRVMINYHGAEIYRHGDWAMSSRLALAHKGIPGILPSWPRATRLVVRQLFFGRDLQDKDMVKEEAEAYATEICEAIERAYAADAEEVLRLTGVAQRPMTLSKL